MAETEQGQEPEGPPAEGEKEDGALIAEFQKNAREVVRVRLTSFRGVPLVDVRAFYEDKDGSRKPGKGLCIRRELLPELRKALQAAEKAARQPIG